MAKYRVSYRNLGRGESVVTVDSICTFKGTSRGSLITRLQSAGGVWVSSDVFIPFPQILSIQTLGNDWTE